MILYDDKIIITYNYSGEHNETSAKIIEEAAEELINEQEKCSDKLLSSPPQGTVAMIQIATVLLIIPYENPLI